jgi:hypothetical protein
MIISAGTLVGSPQVSRAFTSRTFTVCRRCRPLSGQADLGFPRH